MSSRVITLAVTAVLGLAVGVSVPGVASARSAPTSCTDMSDSDGNQLDPTTVDQDIDHDLSPDLVIGVPGADSPGAVDAGAVDIRYAESLGAPRVQRVSEGSFIGLPAPVAGDRFGASTGFAELDAGHHDGCHDLVIGAPGTQGGRGSVVIALGSTSGLSMVAAVRLSGSSVGEHFGASVSVTGDDIWIGAPDRSVAGHARAGAIDHYRISGVNTVSFLESITEDSPGVPGIAETGDRFGAVLHSFLYSAPYFQPFRYAWPSSAVNFLAVGQPSEDVGSAVDAGAAMVLDFDPTTHRVLAGRGVNQDSPGVPGVAEAGDHFGASVWSWAGFLAVGVPGEDVGAVRDAGVMQVFSNARRVGHPLAAYRAVTQDSPGVPGVAEAGDRFGASVAVNWWGIDGGARSLELAVAVGAPGEDIGSVLDAGSVTYVALYSGNTDRTRPSARAWYQSGGLGGVAEKGDQLGYTLTVETQPLSTDDVSYPRDTGGASLVIGVPGEDVGSVTDAGQVTVMHPSSVQTVTDSSGATPATRYGDVGPTSHNG